NPLMEEVGNETALTLGSEQIAIIKNEGNWYGVLVNWNNPKVLFANFGSSLENVPAISEIPMSVPINRPRGVKLIKDGHNFIALIGNTGASLTRLNFGNSMTNAPVADNIVVSGSSGLFGLSHIKDCDNNHVFLSSYNGSIFRLDFGDDLLNTPNIHNLTLSSTSTNPIKIEVVKEGENYHALMVTTAGKLIRLDIGDVVTNNEPDVVDLGTFSELNNTYGLSLQKYSSIYVAHTIAYADRVLRRIEFKSPCHTSFPYSDKNEPTDVSYSTPGTYDITLTDRKSVV